MFFVRQGATHKVVLGPAVAVGDGFTPVTNLDVSTADEAEVILHDNGTVVDISGYTWAAIATADGYYHLTLQSDISNTVGHMTVVVHDDSLCLPLRADFTVIDTVVYDALFKDAAIGELTGVALSATANTAIVDEFETQCQADPTGFHVNVKEVNGTAQTANDNGADINTLVTEVGKVPKSDGSSSWNATALAAIESECNDALVATNLDHLLKTDTTVAADGDLEAYVTAGSVMGHLLSTSADATLYKASTDSMQAIRDHIGDGTNLTEAGATGNHLTAVPWNAAWDAEVQSECTDALNAYDPPTKAELDTAQGAVTVAAIDNIDFGATMKASINTEADNAFATYDPPTKTEMDSAFTEIKGATWAAGTDTLEHIRNKQTDIETDTDVIDDGTSGLVKIASDVAANKVILDALTAAAATKLALSAGTMVTGTVSWDNTNATTTIIYSDDITEATADHYNGRIMLFTSGVLVGQATSISDYELSAGEGKFTVVATTEAAADDTTFIIV